MQQPCSAGHTRARLPWASQTVLLCRLEDVQGPWPQLGPPKAATLILLQGVGFVRNVGQVVWDAQCNLVDIELASAIIIKLMVLHWNLNAAS